MRQQQNGKSKKENLTLTIGKKKSGRKSKRSSSNRNHRVTMENLECISDALHFHAYGVQGAWKLVPKDSCEVYKDQRKNKKQTHSRSGKEKKPTRLNNKRAERKGPKRHEPPSSDRSLSDKDEDSRYNKEKTPRSPKKGKKAPRRRKKNRPSSGESVSSYSTCSRTSVSTPSSDMEH